MPVAVATRSGHYAIVAPLQRARLGEVEPFCGRGRSGNAQAKSRSATRDLMLSTGTKLGPYEIVAPLGAGGMGEVYRARDSRLQREVAIKVLPTDTAANPEALARFG